MNISAFWPKCKAKSLNFGDFGWCWNFSETEIKNHVCNKFSITNQPCHTIIAGDPNLCPLLWSRMYFRFYILPYKKNKWKSAIHLHNQITPRIQEQITVKKQYVVRTKTSSAYLTLSWSLLILIRYWVIFVRRCLILCTSSSGQCSYIMKKRDAIRLTRLTLRWSDKAQQLARYAYEMLFDDFHCFLIIPG